ncbi:hypothetical protein M1N05_01240 [Dehalococcoidales bacterium]|nr:hypothetical protein [Dehalococcoidales bacterium]
MKYGIEGSLREVVEIKAERMLNDGKWRIYGRNFAKELDSEKAFLAGAIDAMIYDVAAMVSSRKIPSHKARKELIKKILRVP